MRSQSTRALAFILPVLVATVTATCDRNPEREEADCARAADFGTGPDARRVAAFLSQYNSRTFRWSREKRRETLDLWISRAALEVGDKAQAFCEIGARADVTSEWEELRLERLLVSVPPPDLSRFKFELEYDLDHKDMEEYVFHDVDDVEIRNRMLRHLESAPPAGQKVLTDVDDTMYANLVDRRYPKKTIYPGVLEFYKALSEEPWTHDGIVLTTLSARPNPAVGVLEESSLRALFEHTDERVRASALSGEVVGSAVGTAQTLVRGGLDAFSVDIPDGQERAIGEAKFANFLRFAAVYPEYRFVFIGDSGQADALTAQLMIMGREPETDRVVTTFIHDLRPNRESARSASPSFLALDPGIVVRPESTETRGVVIFRNYIDVAVQARLHGSELAPLISLDDLATVTARALEEFDDILFEVDASLLREQYREDAAHALTLLGDGHVLADSIRALRVNLLN